MHGRGEGERARHTGSACGLNVVFPPQKEIRHRVRCYHSAVGSRSVSLFMPHCSYSEMFSGHPGFVKPRTRPWNAVHKRNVFVELLLGCFVKCFFAEGAEEAYETLKQLWMLLGVSCCRKAARLVLGEK